jgi:hypothetical protein
MTIQEKYKYLAKGLEKKKKDERRLFSDLVSG